MKVCITKTLKSDNGKEFKEGNSIHFTLNRKDKLYDCFGVIYVLGDKDFRLQNVQVDGMNLSGTLSVKYDEVDYGIIDHEDTGYY